MNETKFWHRYLCNYLLFALVYALNTDHKTFKYFMLNNDKVSFNNSSKVIQAPFCFVLFFFLKSPTKRVIILSHFPLMGAK